MRTHTVLASAPADALFEELTEADLPPRFNRRWSPLMKAKVVAGIAQDLITPAEARARYALSKEELESWQQGLAEYGLQGLTTEGRTLLHRKQRTRDVGRSISA